MEKIVENSTINWNSSDFYLVRDNKLISISSKKWREINEGEKYCIIFQSPSTPPDFGLILKERKPLKIVEGLEDCGLIPWDDEELNFVINFDYINPKDIKSFILQDKKFYNYYD